MRLDHRVELTDDWSLWRDFAVRSSGFPVEGLDGVRARRGAAAGRGGARPGVPRGGGVAEPRVARARRRQARRAARPAARRGAAAGPTSSAATGSATARRTTRSGSSGRWRGARSRTTTAVRSGALERERVVHFETWAMEAVARGIRRCRWARSPSAPAPLLAGTPGLDRAGGRPRGASPRRGARTSPRRSTSSTACSRRSPAGPPRAPRATAAAGGRSPTSTACATSTSRSGPRCSTSCAPRCRPCCTRRAGGAAACSTAAPSCSSASHTGARGRSRRCSAS